MALPQIDLLMHGFGADYNGGTATAYVTGTTTLANWYEDAGGTTPAANPYTLDTLGKAVLYSGERLKIDVKNANDVSAPGFPVDNIGFSIYPLNDDLVANSFTGPLIGNASTATNLTGAERIPFAAAPAFRGCLVYNSTAVSTEQVWASEVYDTDSIHSTSVNTGRLTVPTGVTRVKLAAGIYMGGVAGAAEFHKNGAPVIGGPRQNVAISSNSAISSAVLSCIAGDFFTVYYSQASTADATGLFTWFSMEIVE